MDPNYDYSHSFVSWLSPEPLNVPRMALRASCIIGRRGESGHEYFLSCTCAGENMYVDSDIIQQPVAEFCLVASAAGEFMFEKTLAQSPWLLRLAHRAGESVPSHDGKNRSVSEVQVSLRRYSEVRALANDKEVFAAVMDNRMILGRTQFTAPRGGETMQVVCEYPVLTINVQPDRKTFQVDAGPILMPDFAIDHELDAALFRRAYLVYNSWDYAEYSLHMPVAGTDAAPAHYAAPQPLPATRHELFVVEQI